MKKKLTEIQTEINFYSECGRVGRGGLRPGAGRKRMKPDAKKKVKSFTLSVESQKALRDLQEDLGLSSQTAVVEFLILKAHREMVSQSYIT